MSRVFLAALVVLFSIGVFAQNPITADAPYQVSYAANLNLDDSFINITNTGADGGANICVNVYAITPAEDMVACCGCLVPPDVPMSLSVNNGVLNNTTIGVKPSSVVIKLLSTTNSGTCNGAVANGNPLTSGLAAWMATTHVVTTTTPARYGVPASTTTSLAKDETVFVPSTLSSTELSRLTGTCASIVAEDGGAGICKGCQSGAQ